MRSCGHDLGLAGCIADELADEGNGDADALLAAAYMAARSTLAAASVWAAVEALARALATRQRLNKAPTYRVIRAALSNNDQPVVIAQAMFQETAGGS